jgi:hypothetical protein
MYTQIYNVQLFDDIHNYLPDLLYNNGRFRTVRDVFEYINQMMRVNFDLYSTAAAAARRTVAAAAAAPPMPAAPIYVTSYRTAPVPVPAPPPPPAPAPDFLTLLLGMYAALPEQVAEQTTPTISDLRRETNISTPRTADTMCPICHENIALNRTIRTIAHCGHNFHIGCIDEWFRRSACCPVCRYDIRHNSDSETDADADIDSE